MKKQIQIIIAFAFVCLSATAQNTWTQKVNFGGIVRNQAVGFSIGSKGYIGTGFNGNVSYSGILKDFWEYDQTNDTWTQKADFGGLARTNAVGFSIGSKGYIGTGGDSLGNNLNDFWEYDPSGNNWVQKSNFGGAGRIEAVGFSIGTNGYIGTGVGSAGYNDFWEYNSLTDSWTQKTNYPGAVKYGSVGFSIGNKGFIGTGVDNGGNKQKEFYEYNSLNNSWSQKADFAGTKRREATGFSIGNKGYIGVGSDSTGFRNDFWEYDTLTNSWTQMANFGGVGRYFAVGFSIGTKGYIGTGWNYSGSGIFHNDFYEYTPNTTVGINEQQNNSSITIAPNPFSSSSTITFSSEQKNTTLYINDVLGKELRKEIITGNQYIIEKGELPAGIYFLQLMDEKNNKINKKIVVQ